FANWQELNNETWRAFEKLYADGKVKSIGVSNFLKHHLESLFEFATVKPMVNQIEIHPGHQQQDLVKYSQSLGMVVESWGSLGQSRLLDNPVLKSIGEKYKKSAAQVCLRWLLQRDILPLAKSITQSRMQQNFNVFDFTLSKEDMEAISILPEQGFSELNPDEVEF
ncbi:MAG: aldo/keto reductase, partial [Flavobacteriales bacterium]|nr:aldo/keto reductase [Flavobacteriales bacterium]